ncbi:uncharacterized protein LOC110847228 [Folsomia candida]|uniref:uncharacterized protein LOC110847228 n=1 Tax=Folsomia candida TaxID=158441 RepID=UPI000B906325|nr:uncharacterized protein LOC110847228 [Folsomia candida]
MIPRSNIQFVFTLTGFLLPLVSSVPYKADQDVQPTQQLAPSSKVSVPKFGDVPTNRVLPVDHLTPADYEDIQESNNEVGDTNRENCARLFRADFIKSVKEGRKSRQEDTEQDEEQEGLLASYLDFDPTKVVGPLLNIMGSAAARNSTAIDENYKKLPPFVKLQVTDFIQVFNELLRDIRT